MDASDYSRIIETSSGFNTILEIVASVGSHYHRTRFITGADGHKIQTTPAAIIFLSSFSKVNGEPTSLVHLDRPLLS